MTALFFPGSFLCFHFIDRYISLPGLFRRKTPAIVNKEKELAFSIKLLTILQRKYLCQRRKEYIFHIIARIFKFNHSLTYFIRIAGDLPLLL